MNTTPTTAAPIEDPHTMRLVPEGAPQVYVAGDAVVVQCTPAQVDVLARVLAHYDVLTAVHPADALTDTVDEPRHAAPRLEVAAGYHPGVWREALVSMLTAAARIDTRHIPPALTSKS